MGSLPEWSPSACDEDGDRRLVERTFSDTANSRYRTPLVPLTPTTSSCARLAATAPRRSRSGSPWTSMVPRVPSDAFEFGRLAIEILRRRSRSNRVLASDFTRNGRSARDAAPRGGRQQLHGADKRHAAVPRRDQPADKCQGALGALRSVDTDHDCAYALRSPVFGYEARAVGRDHRPHHARADAAEDAARNDERPGEIPAFLVARRHISQ